VIHFNFSHNVSITLEIRINKHIAWHCQVCRQNCP
jgi:hypothetical protein